MRSWRIARAAIRLKCNGEAHAKPGELAKTGQVRGVDYLLLGKVTNLRVKQEHTGHGGGAMGFELRKKSTNIITDCGVDIRLVDPSSGAAVCSPCTMMPTTVGRAHASRRADTN